MSKCDFTDQFDCQNRIFNVKIRYLASECKSRILNVKIRYSAPVSMSKYDFESQITIFGLSLNVKIGY